MTILRRMKQSGAVLITSLILLLVMTLIGLSSMRSTTLEERMSGNVRNKEIAFQASEAVLREGEVWLLNLSGEPDATLDGGSGVWELNAPDPDDTNHIPWWKESTRDDSWWNTNGTAFSSVLSGVSVMPRYLVEEVQIVRDSLNLGQQNDGAGRSFYRVTSNGAGGNQLARVLLQSTYARRF